MPVEPFKIEEILNSLDGIKKAEAPPYLHSRIQARLQLQPANYFDHSNDLVFRPIFVLAFLFLILLLDGIVLKATFSNNPGQRVATGVESFTSEPGSDAEEVLRSLEWEGVLSDETAYNEYVIDY
jgi:hypothetical protein